MKSVNQVTLLGNLARDPELRYTPAGTPVINFSIATNRSYKEGEEWKEAVDFHNVVFWSKSAEIISQFCFKGSKLLIQGRLQTRSWEKEGVKKYTTEIVGRDFVLLTPKTGEAKKPEAPVEELSTDIVADAEAVFNTKANDSSKSEKIATEVDEGLKKQAKEKLVNGKGEVAPF